MLSKERVRRKLFTITTRSVFFSLKAGFGKAVLTIGLHLIVTVLALGTSQCLSTVM
jgi:hypothetical protein